MDNNWGKDVNLTQEDTKRLIIESHSGNNEAIEVLVKANMGLIVMLAKKYNFSNNDQLFDDLKQTGILATINTIQNIPLEDIDNFSGYLAYNIKHEMQVNLLNTNSSPVTMTYDNVSELRKYKDAITYLQSVGKVPTIKELTKKLNWSSDRLKRVSNLYLQRIKISDDFAENESNSESILDEFVKKEMNDAIKYNLSKLTPREEMIIRLRFGLNPTKIQLNCREISLILNINIRIVRKMKKRALEKLKGTNLKQYLIAE